MSSSSEAAGFGPLATPELRSGEWTRLGGSAVLGDAVTEGLLGALADEARAAARSQGYAVGWSKGWRDAADQAAAHEAERAERAAAAQARREAEHRAAVAALGAAADDVRRLLGDLAARLEEQGTDLAWAIAAEVTGREVAACGPADVVRRVLRALPDAPLATVRVHPSVASSGDAAELVERGLVVVADAGLGPADALVASDGTVVDLRIDEALARVREVLA